MTKLDFDHPVTRALDVAHPGRGRTATALGLALCVIVADVANAASRPPEDLPEGFGVGTTGGRGGQVVRVTTAEQLKHELCRSIGAGGVCSDNEPRIVEVAGTFDYTGSEATKSGPGCDVGKACVAPYKTESLVLLNGDDKHCDGLPTRQIVFDRAGVNPLLVGSNKSVIGVGANATIKGKGLALKGVRNVAIRNLTISDINHGIVFAGDAVTLNDADHVWIDHNRIHNIGRQMIVGGFKPTTHLTISWNDFDGHNVYSHYCNGTHYWNLLLAGSEQSITLSHNWFRDNLRPGTEDRRPIGRDPSREQLLSERILARPGRGRARQGSGRRKLL